MKRHLRTALAFFGILLLLAIGLRHFALRWYPLTGPALLAANGQARILVVGSSHGEELSACLFPEPTFNVSSAGADMFEMCYKIRYVTKRLPSIANVVIVLSPFSYFLDHAAYYRANFHGLAGIRTTLYAQYPGWELISSDLDNFIVGKLYPLVTPDNWAECLYSDDEAPPERTVGLDDHARERTEEMFGDMFKRMETAYDGVIADDSAALLERTIRELRARDIRVALLTPPYWHRYVELLDPAHTRIAQRLTREISRRTGAPYLDYALDSRFSFTPAMFRDSDHLSEAGVARFVPLFMQDWNAGRTTRSEGGN
ncbi:hypothetical protein [Pseudodesulfovibrio sp.]|uniref:hypothetical protein n=1 Tax=Pseudodesulfovibrio sp. TaxID=2035812 RepID=UPI0026269BE6|nr:hypothetical protein [Pseudodesulfovibrio sp.]MDD3312789.1 hypothetical protein [Pseudodesulfovibrio sp.]